MTRSTPSINSFTSGELTPAVQERTDIAAYGSGCRKMRNFVSLPWGGATLRPGRIHAAEAKHADRLARLLEFEFSQDQSYAIEFGDRYLRFFRNKGQIVVDPTDAAITNGGFDTDLTGWGDLSTGSASIAQEFLNVEKLGTLDKAQTAFGSFGDGIVNRRHMGLRFGSGLGGTVQRALIFVPSVSGLTPFDAVAKLYSDNAGSPGVQIGADSDTVNINAAAVFTFTFNPGPVLAADTDYWIVFSHDVGGAGAALLSVTANQINFGTGAADVITNITDGSNFNPIYELRAEVQVIPGAINGVLALIGNGSDLAAAEQSVVTSNIDQEHVLRLRVIGVAGDKASIRIGTTSEGDQILAEMDLRTGFHVVSFTPDMSPFYIQFRNMQNKTIFVDDVELLGSGAASPVPLEISSPYDTADLRSVKYVSSADVMYKVGPDYPTYKLGRLGNATWFVTEVDLIDGPYLDENGDPAKTLDPSALSGGTITAAGHAPFVASDVGRLVRLKHGEVWGAARIRSVASPESVAVEQLPGKNFGGVTPTAAWRLGLYSPSTGFPRAISIYEQRLYLAGAKSRPSRVDGSQSLGEYEDFTPGTGDNDAVAYNIGSNQVNDILWLAAARALLPGTANSEFRLSGSSTQAALTSTNVIARSETKEGVADLRPILVSDVVLFVQRQGKQLHELAFSFEVGSDGGFVSPDISILGQHLLEGVVVDICFQKTPWSIVWMCLEDGRLVGMTYQRSQQVIALHYHPFSGDTAVEAVASIPGQGNDELWLIVRKTIDGQVRRCVEYLADPLLREDPQEDAFHVDAGLSLDNKINATLTPGATSGTGVPFTAGSAVFVSGDVGRIIKYRFSGRDSLGNLEWRRSRAKITGFVSATEVTADIEQNFPSTAVIPAGDWRLTVTSVSGLEHLEGATVRVVGDGAVQSDKLVTGGAVDLDSPAAVVHVGLPYQGTLVPTRPLAGARRGSSQGQVKRIGSVLVSFDRSGPAKVGRSLDRLEPVTHRKAADPLDTAVPLFTGTKAVDFPGDYDREGDIFVVQDLPLPCTVLAIYPDTEVNEG